MPKRHIGNDAMATLTAWQNDLVTQICNAMKAYYCLPERYNQKELAFKKLLIETLAAINQHSFISDEPLTKDGYQPFIDAINKTLSDFDPHLELEYNKDFISERLSQGQCQQNHESNTAIFDFSSGPPKQILLEMNEYRGQRDINYGFTNHPNEDVSISPDIGYLKISFLLDPQMGARESEDKYRVGPNAIKALNESMAKLVGKKGIIIDLRDAPEGGSPEMVQMIVSYFIKQKGMVINEIDDRLTGERKSYQTIDTPYQLFDVPIDILIDDATFSGREELAYDLQQLNIQLQRDGKQVGDRFQIIGEASRGGAHPECSFPLVTSSGTLNQQIILRIPYARSINPTTGTNWEEHEVKGVQPDLYVNKEYALNLAITHLEGVLTKNISRESSHHNNTSIAKEFLAKLRMVGANEPLIAGFLGKDPLNQDGLTFDIILREYASYFDSLNHPADKEKLSTFFWSEIKYFGTPIIEADLKDASQCNVYFLFPKDKLDNTHDLYLQGAFHGYGGVKDRNKLSELSNTGIMLRMDSIPLNALVNYQYHQDGALAINDDYSPHRNVYHHRYSGGIILRVNPDRDQSKLGRYLGMTGEENYWDNILSLTSHHTSRHFRYHTTLYSDANNQLRTCDNPLPKKVDIYDPVPADLKQIADEDFSGSPYADFTRAIHIFMPSSDEIKNVIVFNDGRPYILAGMIDQAEKMAASDKLSPDTAFIFIDALQGLAKTMPGIEKDERFNMGGMGVRLIDFDKGIDNYIVFLKTLFPQLENDLNIPDDPSTRVMVGASLSGTASICIALKEPTLFNHYISQSPSPSNDDILIGLIPGHEANIELSCGVFEQPLFNDTETDCFQYANELEKRLGLQLKQGFYGHNSAAWVEDLDRSLPVVLEIEKTAQSPSVLSQSIFSRTRSSTVNSDDKNSTINQDHKKKSGYV